MPFGSCDCCDKRDVFLGRTVYCGIETFACAQCFGYEDDAFDDFEDDGSVVITDSGTASVVKRG
jgi:hypothetical protein